MFRRISARASTRMQNLHQLSKLLLEKAHVALVPAEAFGAPGYCGCLRHSIERIDEVCAASNVFFRALKPRRNVRPTISYRAFVPRIWGARSLAPLS